MFGRLRGCALALLAFPWGACAPQQGPSLDEIQRARQAIINGEPSDSADDAAIAIPLFNGGQFSGACSGSLIAPNLVLTARHCVSITDESSQCDMDGNALAGGLIYSDRDAKDIGVITGSTLKFDLDASGMFVYTLPSDTLCNSDIALVVLDKPITDMPVAQVRYHAPPVAGETFRAVGWGVSNNSTGYGRRRRDDIPVVTVGPAQDPGGVGGIGNHEMEVGESICSGDSGGPAFAESTKAIIGIVSRGGNGKPLTKDDPQWAACVDSGLYLAYNLYTRVDGFPDLFAQAFASAGAEPWDEGGPDPRKAKTGEACTASDACRSGICVDATSQKGYCSQICDGSKGSCPSGMSCDEVDGNHICRVPSGGCSMAGSSASPSGALLVFVIFSLGLVALMRRRSA